MKHWNGEKYVNSVHKRVGRPTKLKRDKKSCVSLSLSHESKAKLIELSMIEPRRSVSAIVSEMILKAKGV